MRPGPTRVLPARTRPPVVRRVFHRPPAAVSLDWETVRSVLPVRRCVMSKRFAVIVLAALAGPGAAAAQDEKPVLQVKGYVVAGHPFKVSPQSPRPIVPLPPHFPRGAP